MATRAADKQAGQGGKEMEKADQEAPAAPWVNRDRHARVAAASRGTLGEARGSLLLTTGTAFVALDGERKH